MGDSISKAPSAHTKDPVEELVGFVANTHWVDLPPDVIERAKKSVLDFFGCALCGTRSEHAALYRAYFARQGGRTEATVLGQRERTSAYNAAVLNATFCHATELSETYSRAVVHPGNVILPGLLAVAERDGMSGRDVLTAVALGYESLIRFGLSVGPRLIMNQGLHVPSTMGGFGSAIACAKLLGLDEAGIANATGIAACLAPTCLVIAARQDVSIKDLFEGLAAGIGIMSADLAASGVTGVSAVGTHWYAAVPDHYDLQPLTDALGSKWYVSSGGLHFKERALLAMGQPAFDATLEVLKHGPIDPQRIRKIIVETARRSALGGARHPETAVAAKASIPFIVSTALAYPEKVAADPHLVRIMVPALLKDPNIFRLCELVEVVANDEIDFNFEVAWPMKFEARVRVITEDGKEIYGYSDIWAHTSNMTYDDVSAKFERITEGILLHKPARVVISTVRNLDLLPDMRDLINTLRSVTE